MKFLLHTLSALLALGFYIHFTAQLVESQYVPMHCMCPKTKVGVQGPFSDFKVTFKRPGCNRDEIIVVLKKDNRQVCLSPQGPQGKRLLNCWHRRIKEDKNVKTCMGRLRMRRKKHAKSRP